jgi:hypothetical protein
MNHEEEKEEEKGGLEPMDDEKLEVDVEQGGSVEDAAAAAAAAAAGENINEDASSSLLNKESVDPDTGAPAANEAADDDAGNAEQKVTRKREDPPGILPVDANIAEPTTYQGLALTFFVMVCCWALSGGVPWVYEVFWGGGRPENDDT